MEEIGSGSFTVAFRAGSGKVILRSVDPVKRAMSSGKLPKSDLFPEIIFLKKEKRIHVYSMKYYNTLSNKGISGYSEISSLETVLTRKHAKLYTELNDIADSSPIGIRSIINELKKLPDEFSAEREEIIKYAKALSKEVKRTLCFETFAFNVAVKNKKLVLLDCFYPLGVALYDGEDGY